MTLAKLNCWSVHVSVLLILKRNALLMIVTFSKDLHTTLNISIVLKNFWLHSCENWCLTHALGPLNFVVKLL